MNATHIHEVSHKRLNGDTLLLSFSMVGIKPANTITKMTIYIDLLR